MPVKKKDPDAEHLNELRMYNGLTWRWRRHAGGIYIYSPDGKVYIARTNQIMEHQWYSYPNGLRMGFMVHDIPCYVWHSRKPGIKKRVEDFILREVFPHWWEQTEGIYPDTTGKEEGLSWLESL